MKYTDTLSTDSGHQHTCWGQLVCQNCILFICNGDMPDDDEDCARITFEFERYAAEGIEWRKGTEMLVGENDEPVFTEEAVEHSVEECDCCGDNAHGSRYPAHFVTAKR